MSLTDNLRRTHDARPHRHLYRDMRWRGQHGIRLQALIRDRFTCQRCGCMLLTGKPNHPRAATVNHKGDERLFFNLANTESVCKTCHDGRIQREEERGYLVGSDETGRPVDPEHPWNRDCNQNQLRLRESTGSGTSCCFMTRGRCRSTTVPAATGCEAKRRKSRAGLSPRGEHPTAIGLSRATLSISLFDAAVS